jgi:O-antigen ligase
MLGMIRMFQTGDSSELYYIKLGNGVHPSYMSVLVVFAMAVLLDGNTLKRIARYTTPVSFFVIPAVLWLIVFNTMLSSKAGIIVQVMVIILFILRAFFTGNLYRGFVYTGLLIASLSVIPVLFPFTSNRFTQFSETISENKTVSDIDINETKNSRILGWSAAFDLIREHPFLGVGPDGIREELKTAYEDHGLDYGYRNPHNQYLQTWLELGLPGFILLLAMGLVSSILAIRERNYIFFAFLLILYTHMLFESILERRLGILIFAFWLSIFWIASDLRFRAHAKE